MKKLKNKIIILSLVMFIVILSFSTSVFASNTVNAPQEQEYTEAYKKWLELSDEEKKGLIIPRKYVVPYVKKEYKNPLLKANMLKSSLNAQYSLKSVIANNLVIKNQQQTNSCWAFAALSSLETNLALADYKKGNTSKVYDFSERHMEYATSRAFANNQINSLGYNRTVGSGGIWDFASSYLTNGTGAIDEKDMPFENNENTIDISAIQNKEVKTQVYDTVEFPDYNSFLIKEEETSEIINQIKNHIQNHGSVMTAIKAGGTFVAQNPCISNTTGTVRLGNGTFADHAVAIIGWDDNYSISNWDEFDEDYRPKNPGAWIARNSWGEEAGDSGLLYISYEDETASNNMNGIVKATNEVEYENIYQHTYYYPNTISGLYQKNMQCTVFDKKETGTEYLTQVSMYTNESCKCRVFVNENGSGKDKSELKLVQLKEGESENLTAGYHTLELAQPIKLNANQFAVAVEVSPLDGNSAIYLGCVGKDENLYSSVTVEPGRSFQLSDYNYTYNDDWSGWKDLASEQKIGTVKAFTTSDQYDGSLAKIEITTPPSKTSYYEGDNFDKTGMVIKATYNRKTNPSITLSDSDYSITDGNDLKYGQKNVKITYEGKSIEQAIDVEKNDVTELKIITPPTKTEYKEGQPFDKTGMVVEATYRNGNTKTITDYEIESGNNLESNQTSVTIKYADKTAQQEITVKPNPLIEISITKTPNKVNYVVGQDFDKTGMIVTGKYQDESTQEILDYIIENGEKLTVDKSSVTIKYKDKTVEQSITVAEKTVTEISINKMPAKIKYIQNEEDLDLTGGTINVKYNDGSIEEIALTSDSVKVSGFSNKKLGKNTITIEYESKTTTFDVEIIEEKKPKNSNFDNIKHKINEIKAYTYSDSNKEEYFIMDITVDGILRNTENDGYEYYYYLSSNQNDANITDWVKISEEQNSSSSLTFKINSKDMKNISEFSNADGIYLYIKEVALLGGSQSVLTSKAMKLESEVEAKFYFNDELITDSTFKVIDTKETKESKKASSSSTPTRLPNTGLTKLFLLMIVFSITGMFFYIRYKKLSKFIK